MTLFIACWGIVGQLYTCAAPTSIFTVARETARTHHERGMIVTITAKPTLEDAVNERKRRETMAVDPAGSVP